MFAEVIKQMTKNVTGRGLEECSGSMVECLRLD